MRPCNAVLLAAGIGAVVGFGLAGVIIMHAASGWMITPPSVGLLALLPAVKSDWRSITWDRQIAPHLTDLREFIDCFYTPPAAALAEILTDDWFRQAA